MVSKNEIMYSPLINKLCKVITQNKIFEGEIVFESKELIHVISKDEEKKKNCEIKKILKSSIKDFYLIDVKITKFIQINSKLF